MYYYEEKGMFSLFYRNEDVMALDRSRIFVECFQYNAHSYHDYINESYQ